MSKQLEPKFGTTYYRERYRQYLCKLRQKDYTRLGKILKKNGIGFTDFVKMSIDKFEDYEIKKEYELNDKN